MSPATRVVIAERPYGYASDQVIYHLPDGPVDEQVTFQPIKCGGGIAFPGSRETVPIGQVCQQCMSAHNEGAHR